MRDLPQRLLWTARLSKELFTPTGVAVLCEVGRNLTHHVADSLNRRADQLRKTGDLFDRLGVAFMEPQTEVEGRTSSDAHNPPNVRGSRRPFGPLERFFPAIDEVSASERRPVASSKCSCIEGHTTGASAPSGGENVLIQLLVDPMARRDVS